MFSMDTLHLTLIECEAHIHKDAFVSNEWSMFSCSLIWAKLKKNMNFIEQTHFRKCWESA